MKKQMILGLLGLAFLAGMGVADDLVPVAVSPGAENGPAVVRQSCPTFSWTAVSWALMYKVVVFEARDGETPAYEKMAVNASPVLVKEIPGKAFAWTPSADETLINGGSYVWYVGAMVNASQGQWSEGRKFIIAENPAWGVVTEPREDGIRASQVLRDKDLELTAAAKENFNLTDIPMIQGLSDIEGTEGPNNTFYGTQAGNTTMTGAYNSFFGNLAGRLNTTGHSNAFFGQGSGYSNKSGSANTFFGRGTGQANTTATGNTFLGYAAGYKTTTGNSNTFVGVHAGINNQTGYQNTFVGAAAGNVNVSGNKNVFIGNGAGGNNGGYGNVFIGNLAGYLELGSDKLIIDNWNTTTPLIYGSFYEDILRFNGQVGILTTPSTATNHLLDLNGGAYSDGTSWVPGSSREYKENIEELTTTEALQAFEKLEPVKFNYKKNKDEKCLDFIAEDVPDLVAMNDRKGVNPMDLVAMLTKVVQEQQKAITELQEKITKLEKRSRKEK